MGEAMTTTERLSPLDASFLHLENEFAHMHIGSTSIFEGPPPPFEQLRALLESKLDDIPRYRQTARFVPFDLGRPVWADDPHFNVDYHVRHTALPSPGGDAELRLLVARLMSQQLDRARPLWEIWIVEGLDDDRWALVSKVHHAMVDGVSGAELLATMLDVSPEVPEPTPSTWSPRPAPGNLELATEAVVDLVRSPYEQMRALRAATRVPRQAFDQLKEIGAGLSSLSGALSGVASGTLKYDMFPLLAMHLYMSLPDSRTGLSVQPSSFAFCASVTASAPVAAHPSRAATHQRKARRERFDGEVIASQCIGLAPDEERGGPPARPRRHSDNARDAAAVYSE